MQRIGRGFALLAVSTALGLAAGTFIPLPILVMLLAGLTGGRMMLQRRRSRFARRVLTLGSNSRRRAA